MIGGAGFCPSTVCQFWGGWISSPRGNRSENFLNENENDPPPSAHLASVDLIAKPGPKPRCLLQKHPTHSLFPTQKKRRWCSLLPWKFSSWWLNQPILKHISQIGNLPQVGVEIKNNWNQQPVSVGTLQQATFCQKTLLLKNCIPFPVWVV